MVVHGDFNSGGSAVLQHHKWHINRGGVGGNLGQNGRDALAVVHLADSGTAIDGLVNR